MTGRMARRTAPVPPLARWLLARAARPADRASVLADLEEEAATRASRDGSKAAERWCWRQTRRSILPLVWQRLARARAREPGDATSFLPTRLWSGLATDVRHASRRMRREPGFTVVAVLTLALGIGANTAVFTLVNAVMLAPLPVPDPDRLYRLGDNDSCCVNSGLLGDFSIFSWPLYEALRDATPDFAALAAFQAQPQPMGLRAASSPAEPVLTEFVSPNYFDVFNVAPLVGRIWTPEAAAVDGRVPIVLSHAAWQGRFHADAAIVGRSMTLNGRPAMVIGVMPAGFFGDTLRPDTAEAWLPLTLEPLVEGRNSLRDTSDANWLYVIGRLLPDASPTAESAKTTATLRVWLPANLPLTSQDRAALPRQHIVVTPARSGVATLRSANTQALFLLSLAAGAVLLIACANLANLLLVRGHARGPELALRTALGARRSRLVREALVDSLLLALSGGAVGVLMAGLGASTLVRVAFPGAHGMPPASATAWPVLAYAVALSLVAALGFGCLPAVMLSRATALDAIRGSNRVVGDRGAWPRRALVVVQVALSLALVASAGLLGRSAYNLQAQSFGFATEGRVMVGLDPSLGGLTPDELPPTYQRLEERLSSLSNVRTVSLSLYGPMVGNNWSSGIVAEGRPASDRLGSSWDRVSARYFETIGTRVIRGRVFDARDTPGAERTAVVNERFAARFFPGQEAIGRHFGFRTDEGGRERDFTVVGIVADAKYADARDVAYPTFFLPFFQDVPFASGAERSMQTRSNYAGDVELWVHLPAPGLEGDVRAAIASVSPNLVVRRFRPMGEQIAGNFTRDRLVTWLATLFAGLALVLACVGLYGVTTYSVSRRTRDIGVRMALGADRRRVISGVLTSALVQTAVGLIIGLPATIGAGRLLREQLFDVSETDAKVLGVSVLLLLAATAIAGAIPARRAASIDPIKALRSE
jgi:predicted permease